MVLSIGFLVQLWSAERLWRLCGQTERREEKMRRSVSAHRETGSDICGSTYLLWEGWRKRSGAVGLLRAVGRRVWSYCHRILPSSCLHTQEYALVNAYKHTWQVTSTFSMQTHNHLQLRTGDDGSHRCRPCGGCCFRFAPASVTWIMYEKWNKDINLCSSTSRTHTHTSFHSQLYEVSQRW